MGHHRQRVRRPPRALRDQLRRQPRGNSHRRAARCDRLGPIRALEELRRPMHGRIRPRRLDGTRSRQPGRRQRAPLAGSMTLQLLLLGDVPVAQLVERARLAEANGYSAVWVADERFYREVYSCLGQIAAHTTKILLGPCVTDPYARHPAPTAMAIATLDEISGGRAILGIGAGISGFAELGIDRKKPAQAIRVAIELIRALLRGETVDYRGEVVAFSRG